MNKNIFNTSKCNSTYNNLDQSSLWIHPTPDTPSNQDTEVPQLEESLELEWGSPPRAGPQAVDQVGHFSGS